MNFEQKKHFLTNSHTPEAAIISNQQLLIALINDYSNFLQREFDISKDDTQKRIIESAWDGLAEHEKTYLSNR